MDCTFLACSENKGADQFWGFRKAGASFIYNNNVKYIKIYQAERFI